MRAHGSDLVLPGGGNRLKYLYRKPRRERRGRQGVRMM